MYGILYMNNTSSLNLKHLSNKKKNLYIYSVISLFGIVLATLLPSQDTGFSICLFYNITGIPCPGCGMGRAIIHFFHLHFIESFYYHPFGIFVALFMVYFSLCMVFPFLGSLIFKYQKFWNFFMSIVVVLLLAFFAFRVYYVVLAPEKLSPYFYNFQNRTSLWKF